MKKLTALILVLLTSGLQLVVACDVCEQNQPKLLKNITHGPGPSGTLDYIITWTAVVLVVIALYVSIRYLVRPRETNSDHVKNIVLHED